MLGWLAAAAAPWLIHLLSRRKYRETAWAAMDFLLAAVKRRARRIRVEQWLLLALRTLLIVALVTAVAEPYLERAVAVFSPNGNTHRVLVIDSSYSMAYKTAGRTRFEQAKQWAAQIVEQSAKGDGFTLVQMASPPRVIVATPGLEKEPVRQEIQNLQLLHTGADLAATLAEVRKVLDTARRDSPRLAQHEVYFFSDLQRATWMPAGDAAEADCRSRAAALAAQLHVINLGQPGDDNLAVTALELRQPLVLAGRSVALEASLRDFGHLARPHQAVDLLVDDHPAGRQYVDIPADGSAVARFLHGFQSAGDHAVEVRFAGEAHTSPDSLDIDNRRFLAVHVRQAIRVLCVDGRPTGDPRQSSVFYLTRALLSNSVANHGSPVDLQAAVENAILERNLGQYDCVMLSSVRQFTASEARVLDNYLAHGGSLVFFLGDGVNAENYNSVLADPSRPLLPARLVAAAKAPGGSLDALDYRHPIVGKFRGQEETGLLRAPIWQYFKVQLAEAGGGRKGQPAGRAPAEVALALGNGDPLIVAQPIRRGRVVLVTTAADASWSDLPTGGTYEPLVKEILAWCIAGQAQPRNVAVGDPLESALAATPALADVSIERPDGQRRTVPLEVHGDYSSWRYDDTLISGIYTARFAAPLSQSQLFAVNLLTAESDLTPISQEELRGEVWPGIPLDYETSWQGTGTPLPSPSATSGQLHVGLLYAVVVLLLLELVLAWRFGYNAR